LAYSALTTLHNIAHPANHLLTVQLVAQESAPSTRINLKPEHFYFLTLAPGEGNAANRTYNFANKINLKFSISEIFALSFTLQQCSIGNGKRVLPYSKFARSQSGQKTVSVIEGTKNTKMGETRTITIFVNCDGNNNAITLSPAEAYGLSKQLDLSAVEATKLEFTRISSQPSFQQQQSVNQPQQQPTYSMPQQPTANGTPFQQQTQITPVIPNPQPMVSNASAFQSSDEIADRFSAMLNNK